MSFDVVGEPRRDPLPISGAEIEEQAVNLRPDLQALKRDHARSLAEVRLQIAHRQIDYTIGTEYRRQQGVNGKASSLGFFLSVPLPIFDRNQGEIARAQQEQLQIETRLRALEAEIRNEVRSAYQEYETARSLLTTMETDMLQQARQVLQTMNYSYRRGEASLVEFLMRSARSMKRCKVTTTLGKPMREASMRSTLSWGKRCNDAADSSNGLAGAHLIASACDARTRRKKTNAALYRSDYGFIDRTRRHCARLA